MQFKIFILSFVFPLLGFSVAYDACLELDSLEEGVVSQEYNNDNLYPAGAILYDEDGIQLVKPNPSTFNQNSNSDPTVLYSVSSDELVFSGYLKFTLNTSSNCKNMVVSFEGVDTLLLDDEQYVFQDMVFPTTNANGVYIDTLNSTTLVIEGDFETFSIRGSTGVLYDACWLDCQENCSAGFSYQNIADGIQFQNESSIGPEDATFFTWDFGGGNISNNENPLIELPVGQNDVCLQITDDNCFPNGEEYCESITIELNDEPCFTGHQIMTPNEDGQDDFLNLPKGSIVFDQFGRIVFKSNNTIQWIGTDNNGQNLPTGAYKVKCSSNSSFDITIIR